MKLCDQGLSSVLDNIKVLVTEYAWQAGVFRPVQVARRAPNLNKLASTPYPGWLIQAITGDDC